VRKSPAVVCNKRTIESLVKGGSFDSLQHTRQGLLRVHEAYVDALVDEKKQEAIGQDSLFGVFSDDAGDDGEASGHGTSLLAMPPIPTIEWDKATLLAFEREMLGLYVSDHPLFGIEHILAQHADTSIAALTGDDTKPDGANVTIAGLITGLQIKRTKKGDLWAIATVEDLDGAIDCLFFPSAYMTVSTMLGHDVVCVVRGRLNRRDETPTIFAQELTLPDIKDGPRGPVVVTLPLARATNGVAERIKRVLGEHPGVTEVHLKLTQPGRSVLMRLDDSLRVTASPALFGDLKALLGPACLT
jgi:DNA polymerase-3 subunit alpha